MSISMGQLATNFFERAKKVPEATDQKLRTVVEVGVGIMKSEIQRMHAVDTGTMLNSTTSEKTGDNAYLIGPTVKYAPYVALGTSRMPARPFHLTSAKKLQAQIPSIVKELGI